jgi:hypothetical protein
MEDTSDSAVSRSADVDMITGAIILYSREGHSRFLTEVKLCKTAFN